MILGAAVQWGLWADGCIRLMEGGHNLARGPLGILLYLVFAPGYWLVPARHRATYLWSTSLLTVLVSLGPAYALMLTALLALSLTIVRLCGHPGRVALGGAILAAVYLALILYPQPPFLPAVREPLYFYLHWAGIGYLFLRSYHLLIDSAKGLITSTSVGEFLAYLLFAPTLRMGPIYRFGDFAAQMHEGATRYRNFPAAAGRLITGAIRLAIMGVLVDKLPMEKLFDEPASLSTPMLILHIYAAPMAIYFWISAYIDWSIAVGYVLGFRVPDNFNYPWRSTSIAEFWRRWHITLGLWIRDYLYIPLGGNRRHVFFNYTVAFLFVGLWHGTYPSYALWGLSQGVGLAVRRMWSQTWKQSQENATPLYRRLEKLKLVNSPLNAALSWLLTFNYQIVTISIFLDEKHTWWLLGRHLLKIVGIEL